MSRNDTRRTNEPMAKILSRSGRMLKPRVFKDGTTAAESPRHSSAEDDLSPMAVDVKERLEKPQGSRSSNDSRSSNGAMGVPGVPGVPGVLGASGKKRKQPPRTMGGGIFKAAAVQVLRDEARLMTTGEITKVALQRGYISCSGKTPDATMASALYTDIKRRSGETAFVRPKEGLFGLKEWHGNDTDIDNDIGSGVGRVERAAAAGPTWSVCPKAPPARVEPAPPSGAFRLQAPADTTGSHCLALPRDGLIDLLSAAEKVNGIEMSPAGQAGEWQRQPDEQRGDLRHRRKMIMTAEHYDKNNVWVNATGAVNGFCPGNKNENATASVGEMGSIADPMKQENESTEHNNANGYMDRDHCVQSPRTRALSEVMPGYVAGLGENVGFQLEAIISVSKELNELLGCVNSCPDEVQRSRGLTAVIELARQLTPLPGDWK
jgi:hypothetical protein